MPKSTFSGELRVTSKIVDYLSSGLYETPAACLKELVNNSYDADATKAEIFIKPDADRIIIDDDGVGLSRDEFESHFRHISESHKREQSDLTPSGRPKIGRIGIGAIAANELCDMMEIVSTKRGSTDLLRVSIDFRTLRQEGATRRRGSGGKEFAKGKYEGAVEAASSAEHYTRIFLKDIRASAKEMFAGVQSRDTASPLSIYGKSPSDVEGLLAEPALKTWGQFDSYSENVLRVALNVPVGYHDRWAPPRAMKSLAQFSDTAARLGFRLYFDGVEVFKPIVLTGRPFVARTFDYEGENVSAHGYFFARGATIHPQELAGVLIRDPPRCRRFI